MGPGDLDQALCNLPLIPDPNLIVGMESLDDAAVYKLTDELAIIQTIDFITPIVDDPYMFGQIAAANALSDVYAMGGKPLTALNVVCFPLKAMGVPVLRDILRGGIDKLQEAGATLVGGHSVDDPELKYGMSVTGIIHPQKIATKGGARVGDSLILTKPLGTGVISTALKGGAITEQAASEMIKSMASLNRIASELMQAVGVHACTDITGFGLLGHVREMVQLSGLGMEINFGAIPFYPRTVELAQEGFFPGGAYRNKEFSKDMVEVAAELPEIALDLLFDPQTSGGLLISLPRRKANLLLSRLHQAGLSAAAIIGQTIKLPQPKIILH